MRPIIYEAVAFGLMGSSAFAYYECVAFLASKNYLAGLAAILIGFSLLRVGLELSRLAVVVRRES